MVVGGGNSAGQAVVNLTSYARRIHLVVRRELSATIVEDSGDIRDLTEVAVEAATALLRPRPA